MASWESMDTPAEESCRRETLVLDNHFTVPNMDVVRTHGFAARWPYKGAPPSPCNSRDLYEFSNHHFVSLHSRLTHWRHSGPVLIENTLDSPAASINCLEFQEMETSLSPLPAKMNQASFQHLDGETASR